MQNRVKFMIRDRGPNFTAAFDAVLADAGIRTVLCSVRTPAAPSRHPPESTAYTLDSASGGIFPDRRTAASASPAVAAPGSARKSTPISPPALDGLNPISVVTLARCPVGSRSSTLWRRRWGSSAMVSAASSAHIRASTAAISVSVRGYCLAIGFSAALLIVLNGSPGWQAMPFLTSDTGQVLWLVNFSLAAGIAANVVYLAYDPPWVRSPGGLATTGIGLATAIRLWQVFPFALSSGWSTAVRVLLVVAIAGSCIALVVQIVSLARWFTGHTPHGGHLRTGH